LEPADASWRLDSLAEERLVFAELEAESTAYVVCQALRIDGSDYSLGYVATLVRRLA
jgi:hypothetical protein